MKKILLVMSIIAVLSLAGCNSNENIVNNEVSGEEINQQDDERTIDLVAEEKRNEMDNKYILTNPDNDYIIVDSSNRVIDASDTSFLSIDELNIARNEIFARYGHDFKNKDLKEYFESKPWYSAIDNKSIAMEELNEIEQKNILAIDSRISDLKNIDSTVKKFEFDANKPLVYAFYEKEEKTGRIFRFPYINIIGDEIKRINNKIYEWACPIIDDTYFECGRADYYYFENNGILSIIVEEECDYGGETGFFYNIDLNTGKTLSNEEILTKHNISVSEFKGLKREIIIKLISQRLNNGSQLSEGEISKIDEFLNSKTNAIKLPKLNEYSDMEEAMAENQYVQDLRLCQTINNCNFNEPNDLEMIYFDSNDDMHIIIKLDNLAGTADASEYFDCTIYSKIINANEEISINKLLQDFSYETMEYGEFLLGSFNYNKDKYEIYYIYDKFDGERDERVEIKCENKIIYNGDIIGIDLGSDLTIKMYNDLLVCINGKFSDSTGGYMLTLIDTNTKKEIFNKSAYFLKDIKYEGGKIYYSSYDKEKGNGYYYRADYELTKDGTSIIVKTLSEDKEDTRFSSQMA